jgi:hypothetical protein
LDDDRDLPIARGRRSTRKRLLIAATVIAMLATMGVHLFMSPEEVSQLRRLSVSVLLVALLLQFLSQLVWNGAMLLPLQQHLRGLGFWELFMVRTGGFVVGFMVPIAGSLAVRLTYLRRRGLAYSHFTWATLLSNALSLLTVAVLTVAAVGALWMLAGAPAPEVLGLAAGVLAAGIAGPVLLQWLPSLAEHRMFHRWPWLSGISGFRAGRYVLVSVFALALARHCCNFLTFGLLYQSLSPESSEILTGGLVYALTSPVRMLHITPGNIGVNEWIVALVGKTLSYDLTTGLLMALLFRGMNFAAQGLGVLASGAWLALWGE